MADSRPQLGGEGIAVMAVYVDELFTWPLENTPPGQARRVAQCHGGRWCHMIADSKPELLAMAKRIGLRTEWIQKWRGSEIFHFDLVPTKRRLAVAAGAVALSAREFREHIAKLAEFIDAMEKKTTRHDHANR